MDYQLAWQCPHLTVEEVVPLAGDRRSLLCRQPVGSLGTVRILVNDEFFIPQTGLMSAAQLFSTQSGPFDLVEGEDTFTVTTSAGTVTVKLGIRGRQRWQTDAVVKKLMVAPTFATKALVENANGHLVITDISKVGLDSFVKVEGTAAAALGFGADGVNSLQRRARGKRLFPGWKLGQRQDEILNRYPQFVEPIQGNHIFKMTYSVPPQRCLRCRGTHVENDMRFASDGHAILVDNEDLLYQAALKVLLTDRGSNAFHSWYGTTIRSKVGAKALGGVASAISEDIRRALGKFQTVQQEQAKYQVVTPQERLYSVTRINVAPHSQDPSTFLVEVTVQNASMEPIDLSIVFTVPSVVALMGSNGLMLGTEAAGVQDLRF